MVNKSSARHALEPIGGRRAGSSSLPSVNEDSGEELTRGSPPQAALLRQYIDGIYEKTDTGAITKYYYAFGRRVAMRSPNGSLTYLLADHLGSTVGAIDSTGTVTAQTYWPFGGTRTTSGALGTDKQYTGQQVENGDAGLGLYNYNARFYSTVLGRFASADTVTTDGLNRYAYVRNSPMNYDDPTGHGAPGIVDPRPGHPCTPDSPSDPSDACNVSRGAPVSANDPCQGDLRCGLLAGQAYCSGAGQGLPICGEASSAEPVEAPHEGDSHPCGWDVWCRLKRDYGPPYTASKIIQMVDIAPLQEGCLLIVGSSFTGGVACAAGDLVSNGLATTVTQVQIFNSDCSWQRKAVATGINAGNYLADFELPWLAQIAVEAAANSATNAVTEC